MTLELGGILVVVSHIARPLPALPSGKLRQAHQGDHLAEARHPARLSSSRQGECCVM